MRTATVPTLADAGHLMAGQLADAVCGTAGTYLTWREHGPVLQPHDFEYGDPGGGIGIGFDLDAQCRLVRQAGVVSGLVDGVGSGTLPAVYADVLRRGRVAPSGLTAEDALKLDKYLTLLRGTRTVTDPVTGEEREITDESPMLKAYHARQAAYLVAELRRNLAAIAGCNGPAGDPRSTVGDAVGAAVGDAMHAWIVSGYRDEVDRVTAYLDQTGGRDLALWRRHLLRMCDGAQLGGFPFTTLVPGDFATGDGWCDYVVDPPTVERGWPAGPAPWPEDSTSPAGAVELDAFAVSCQLTVALVSRPWFHAGFLTSPGWDLPGGELLCDGGDPPTGRLVGYPTAVVFARDLRIRAPGLAATLRAGGGVPAGWGPFRLAGGRVEPDLLTVPGLQAVALVNRRLGRTPPPSPRTAR